MDDSLPATFDVAVKHRRVRIQTQLVGRSVDVEPLVATNLSLPCSVVSSVVEDFGSSARKRPQTRILEVLKRREHAIESIPPSLGDSLKMDDLHRGEGL